MFGSSLTYPSIIPSKTRRPRPYWVALLICIPALLILSDLWGGPRGVLWLIGLFGTVISAAYGGFWPGIVTLGTYLLALMYYLFAFRPTPLYPNGAILILTQAALGFAVCWLQERTLRAETAMRDSMRLLDTFLKNAPDAITVQSQQGQTIFINDAAVQLFGLKSVDDAFNTPIEEMRGRYICEDEQGNNIPLDALPQRIVFANRSIAGRVYLFRNTQAQIERWISHQAAPVFDNAGNVRYAINIVRDVTAEKLKERQMAQLSALVAEQNQRLAAILSNVPGVIWEAKGHPAVDQTVSFVSPYIEKMMGYSPAETIADPRIWREIVYPEDRQRAVMEASAVYTSKSGGMVQYRWIGKDGRVVDVESYTSIVRDEQGNPTAVYGVTMDVTARKQAEDELSRYAQDLKRSNEELRQFAYVASHDLQEPLRMVASYLQLIEQRYKDKLDPDGKEFIGYAVDGAKRMKHLINDLLAYSHVETKGREFTMVDSQKALRQALKNLELSVADSKAEITMDTLPTIVADEYQIVQLFQNLLGNAIKFRGDHAPKIHISAEDKPGKWQFIVRDNGIGIESDSLERIFVIFQRLHNREKYEGTGIGLAICKKIVERHNGQIWAESELGHGSCFYFTIPKRTRRSLK